VDRAAALAGSKSAIGIKPFKNGRKIGDDALQLQLRAMDDRMTISAVPLESIEHPRGSSSLYNKTATSSNRALRRMGHVWWEKEYIALLNCNVVWATVFPNAQRHVAGQLIKELLQRVVVIVSALIRSAYYCDDEISITPYLCIPDWGPEVHSVLVDPMPKIDRGGALRHDYSCVPPSVSSLSGQDGLP
jgi:hypothetical protein